MTTLPSSPRTSSQLSAAGTRPSLHCQRQQRRPTSTHFPTVTASVRRPIVRHHRLPKPPDASVNLVRPTNKTSLLDGSSAESAKLSQSIGRPPLQSTHVVAAPRGFPKQLRVMTWMSRKRRLRRLDDEYEGQGRDQSLDQGRAALRRQGRATPTTRISFVVSR